MIDYNKFCKRCKHYLFDIQKGILCGLTQQEPEFEGDCKDFFLDSEKEKQLAKKPVSPSYKEAPEEEGMTAGEWLGAIICTPYGLIKYFDWKKQYPRKSKQVCIFYLIAIPIAILLRLLTISSNY